MDGMLLIRHHFRSKVTLIERHNFCRREVLKFIFVLFADRHECGEYVNQVNECHMQLESYVTDLQHEARHRSILIELLEQSELYYDVQNSEATIVANVSN